MDPENQWCFACGKNNPIGLRLVFSEKNESYCTTFTAGPEHQSYNGVMHGGLVSTLLDEVMAGYLYAKDLHAVTARLDIRFRQPTPIGQELTVTGKIKGNRGNMYEMVSWITLPDGTITAEGKATVAVLEEKS